METQLNASERFQRILVAVDADGLAAQAVLQAYTLAQQLGSRVELLHVRREPRAAWRAEGGLPMASAHAASLESARKHILETLRPALVAAGHDVRAADEQLRVLSGHAAQLILRHVEERGAELLMIGPHARRSLFDFGNTTRALLSQARVPVWAQSDTAEPVRRIQVAVDFSAQSVHALEHAHALAQRLDDASLEIVHVYTPPAFAYANAPPMPEPIYVIEAERADARRSLDKLMSEFDWRGVQAQAVFLEGPTVELLGETARDADLLVVGTHGRTSISRFLLGSVAYGLLRRAAKPVLAVPSPHASALLEAPAAAQRLSAGPASESLGVPPID